MLTRRCSIVPTVLLALLLLRSGRRRDSGRSQSVRLPSLARARRRRTSIASFQAHTTDDNHPFHPPVPLLPHLPPRAHAVRAVVEARGQRVQVGRVDGPWRSWMRPAPLRRRGRARGRRRRFPLRRDGRPPPVRTSRGHRVVAVAAAVRVQAVVQQQVQVVLGDQRASAAPTVRGGVVLKGGLGRPRCCAVELT